MAKYELNLSMEELEKRTHKDYLTTKKMLEPTSVEYTSLEDGDKKALVHLVKAAYILEKINKQLDNHHNLPFEKFLNDKISSVAVEKQLQEKVINWFIENNINYNDFSNLIELNDFTIHMFDTSEFIEMCANVCNWLSLYKKDNDISITSL